MNATLILVLAEDCGGCVMFKQSFKDNLIESYKKKGIKVVEKNIASMRVGPTLKEAGNHQFLRKVKHYPFITLVRTDVLDGDYSDDDICSSLFVYNGKVNHTTNGIVISSMNPGIYGAGTKEFERYLTDFSKSKKYIREVKKTEVSREQIVAVKPPSSLSQVERKYNCRRVTAIPYVKK